MCTSEKGRFFASASLGWDEEEKDEDEEEEGEVRPVPTAPAAGFSKTSATGAVLRPDKPGKAIALALRGTVMT
jgi:hypothetical protein